MDIWEISFIVHHAINHMEKSLNTYAKKHVENAIDIVIVMAQIRKYYVLNVIDILVMQCVLTII